MVDRAEFLYRIQSTDLPLVVANKNKQRIEYINVPAAFDLEASSFYINDQKAACMYIWQFGMCGEVTYGRTWNEFDAFFKVLSDILDLTDERRLLIYVHNLQYDFQWFRKRFNWDHVFLLEERSPVYARIGGLEFRDSLKLAGGKPLAEVGKDLKKYPVQKAVGDLDYNLVRSPQTELSPTELHYCEYDVRVLMSYIQEKIEQDGDISKIPLTNTGYVRRYCHDACFPEMEEVSSNDSEFDLNGF